eukprot:gene12486-11058_t
MSPLPAAGVPTAAPAQQQGVAQGAPVYAMNGQQQPDVALFAQQMLRLHAALGPAALAGFSQLQGALQASAALAAAQSAGGGAANAAHWPPARTAPPMPHTSAWRQQQPAIPFPQQQQQHRPPARPPQMGAQPTATATARRSPDGRRARRSGAPGRPLTETEIRQHILTNGIEET